MHGWTGNLMEDTIEPCGKDFRGKNGTRWTARLMRKAYTTIPQTMSVSVPESSMNHIGAMTGAGFISVSDPHDLGGMGMPQCVSVACKEFFCAASAALSFFTLLTGSAAGLITPVRQR